ncbi:hypothetical protein Tco_0544899 [Tanacetum coccineum]
MDKKVKIIRSDNRTEFKNKVMDDFCREKGTQGELNVGTSDEISQDCIVMPIWKDASYFDSPTKDVDNGEPKTADDAQKQVEDSPENENAEQDKFEDDSWLERITKKRTKNKAKTTKPDSEWKRL